MSHTSRTTCAVKRTETHPFLSPLSCPRPARTAPRLCPPLALDFTFKLSSSSATTTAHQMLALQWHRTPQRPRRPSRSPHTHPRMARPSTSPSAPRRARCATLQCSPLPAFDTSLLTAAPPTLAADSANTLLLWSLTSSSLHAPISSTSCSRTLSAWPPGAGVVLRWPFRISLLLTLARPYSAVGDAARREHTVSYILRPITPLSLPTHLQHPSSADSVSFLSPPLLTKHTVSCKADPRCGGDKR